ncbi:RING/U-box protein [Forsythia ovata]|uniref:RING/U-box protein n=1 Tax=Forsythia ovata TaxID=205694 RepID=A0ABD1PXK4_9LAMI
MYYSILSVILSPEMKMVKGRNMRSKPNTRTRVRLDNNDLDKWDEDYKVNIDEFDELEDVYCSSLDEDESEESLGAFEEGAEEEEWVKTKVNKARKPTGQKGVLGRKKNGVWKPKKRSIVQRNRKRVSVKEEEDDVIEVSSGEEDDDFSYQKPRKKAKSSYREEEEDDDYNHSEFEEDDEEFIPDEIDGADDEEDLPSTNKKKKKVGRLNKQKKGTAKVRKRRRNAKALKKTKRKKPIKNQGSRKKTRSPHGKESRDGYLTLHKKKKKLTGRGRKKSGVYSVSDFMGSGSSSYQYTMSEEEREQVREASEFCGSLTTALRSSCSSKMNEKEILPPQEKSSGRKGKEKVENVKIETGKQVCGICLSEEGKSTVRGTLNCCSHYFCFACIMEWSKVESRCPICKQRFSSISKTARADGRHDSRSVVISVPARDQVYQPSEEELRDYLDPYENVLCTECHIGGDDALMLLCDLCDSPAHTYCVGLGHEVPEGNWYCEGCRPAALASSNAQVLNPSPSHGASNNLSVGSSPVASVRGTFDLNELYMPDTSLTPGTDFSPPPRVHDFQAAAPASGWGAYTVFERRRIQHQINQLLNNRSRRQPDRTNGVSRVSGNSLFGWQVGRGRELAPQHTVAPERILPQNMYLQGRLLDSTTASLCSREAVSPRFSSLREQILPNQASTSTDHSFGRPAQNEFIEINTVLGLGLDHQQPHPFSSRSNILNDVHISPPLLGEVRPSPIEKEQVQSMVRSHLKSLSRNLELGYITFKGIARSSTHTILAACGLEHRRNEVYPVHKPLNCNHFERVAVTQRSLMKGQCSSCFDLFVRSVVREIMRTRIPLSSRD